MTRSAPVLVSSHISGENCFQVSIYAGIAQIKVDRRTVTKSTQTHTRGTINTFSRQSRKRLLERLARMRNCDTGYFCTLTYPGEFRYGWEECKAHLAALRKRLVYRCPEVRVIWRMEVVRRKSGASEGKLVPHFHLLVFGISPERMLKFRLWLRENWDAIANNADSDCPMLRTQCDAIESHKHAVYYAAKYVAKTGEERSQWGRHWGTFGYFDESESAVIEMTPYQMLTFRRYCRSYLKSKGRRRVARMLASIREDFGFSVFGIGDAEPDETGFALAMRFAMASMD